MIDPATYRANELLAKSMSPHWRIAQTHNLDHFERAGFPVRISTVREIGPIIDSMQENRFDSYMKELGTGWDQARSTCSRGRRSAAMRSVSSSHLLPHRAPVLPLSTLFSVLVLYKKLRGIKPDFRTLLEIGPGCGYLSFVLRHHAAIENYSQIEACESFYILQNLVNLHCFGHLCDDRALPHEETSAIDVFAAEGPVLEFSNKIQLAGINARSTHYPWWRLGELISRQRQFDIVSSNANLLEFNRTALDDYLSLIQRVMSPEGVLLVQCTGYPAQGNDESLLNTMHDKGFAPLLFVQPNKPAKCPATGSESVRTAVDQGTLPQVTFNVTNALFIKKGHRLFSTYYDKRNFHLHFIAPEPIVVRTYFDHGRLAVPTTRQQHFAEEVERSLGNDGAALPTTAGEDEVRTVGAGRNRPKCEAGAAPRHSLRLWREIHQHSDEYRAAQSGRADRRNSG